MLRGYVYVCPNAPLSVRTGFGSLGYAWTTPGAGDTGDTEEEAACAEEMLATLFEEAMSLYTTPPGQAVLGGFSQGGMMTYRAGLTNPDTFRGLIVLSSRVRDADSLRDRLPATRTQPIFIAHGTGDSMIAVEEARESRGFLEAEGYVPDYREYAMGHEINEHVLADLVPWLHGVLPPARPPNLKGEGQDGQDRGYRCRKRGVHAASGG